jgi:hypothetical protein
MLSHQSGRESFFVNDNLTEALSEVAPENRPLGPRRVETVLGACSPLLVKPLNLLYHIPRVVDLSLEVSRANNELGAPHRLLLVDAFDLLDL